MTGFERFVVEVGGCLLLYEHTVRLVHSDAKRKTDFERFILLRWEDVCLKWEGEVSYERNCKIA